MSDPIADMLTRIRNAVRANKRQVRVTLKYDQNGQSVIGEIDRVSKPGRRTYCSVEKVPRVRGGMGIAIVSTSKGVFSDRQCRKQNVGGEIICTVAS